MQLTTDDGLSFNAVYSIIQDKDGFMWFGTFNGIDRFDGVEIKNYRHKDFQGLQIVLSMCVDSLGNLWHGGHLIKYDPKTDKDQIIYFYVDSVPRWAAWYNDMRVGPNDSLYLVGNNRIYTKDLNNADTVVFEILVAEDHHNLKNINKIRFDDEHTAWLGTEKGLYKWDIHNNILTPYDRIQYPEQKFVKDFIFAENGDLWIAFDDQLIVYNFLQDNTVTYTLPGTYTPVLTKILQSQNGTIWVGTNEEGLFYLDKQKDRFVCLTDQKNVTALYEDRSGRLWIGTDNQGVFVYDSLKNFFSRLSVSVSDKEITSFQAHEVERSGEDGLWIATASYGLLHYNLRTRKTSIIDRTNLHNDFLYTDKQGKVWYGALEYLVCYDPVSGTFEHIKHPVPDQAPVTNFGNLVRCIVEFQDKFIMSSDYGQVHSYDPSTGKFELVFETGRPIREMHVRNDSLFIAAYHTGLIVMDASFSVLDTLYRDGGSDYAIFKLHSDRSGMLWEAGFGGISLIDPRTKEYKCLYDLTDPMDYLCDIREDSLGNLWFASVLGIYKYDPVAQDLQFFDSNHGLPTGRIWRGTLQGASESRMYFGSNNGVVHFNPYLVRKNAESPQLVFTDFIINYSSSEDSIRNEAVLVQNINYTDEIHLNYRQNSFTIKFAALNYTSSHYNQYKFKLEGLDNEWQFAGNLAQANYTNLDGGDYTFYFTGSNNDGVWNDEPRMLSIHIDPPPWKTAWAYAIYVLFLLGIAFSIYYYSIRRIRLRHQLEIKTRESEYLQEIDEAKTKFFTNISHELRTPLTLIIDPANQLMQDEQTGPKQENLLGLILSNAQRLLNLINQILDLARLRSTRLKLHAEEVDITALLKPLLHAFKSRAEALSLDYTISLPDRGIKVWIDREKIEQTVINLVANAFKFCLQGEVKVIVQDDEEKVVIRVEDTGIGIPADQVEKIFDNYYQVESPYTKDMAGSGIGLYLAREYVRLHKGSIEVKSEEKVGTTFTLSLLKGRDHLNPEQIIQKSDLPEPSAIPYSTPTIHSADSKTLSTSSPEGKPLVLVIEDNPEMTKYLLDSLTGDYRLLSARNGEEGLEKTLDHLPDVVICDVMMPLVDGFSYCQNVKTDANISHIPLILLTARNLADDKIKGLSLGADDYMIKPFQMTELKLRVNYHLENRAKIRARFLKDFKLKAENELIKSLKDQFLQKVFSHIEAHYGDEQFGVEELSDLMAMSKKHLNHKIKSLTDQNTNELIRNFRLRKAAYLLSERSGSVTSICYDVGFNNPSYFSKCFFEFFGKSPSEYGDTYS